MSSLLFAFRYTYSVLANLLAPKISLCDKEFEVSVDNLVFVGYPMLASNQQGKGSKLQVKHCFGQGRMRMKRRRTGCFVKD